MRAVLIGVAGANYYAPSKSALVHTEDGDLEIPVARLMHIVTSKALAARPKDHLFIATHSGALSEMLARDERTPPDAPS